MKVSIIISNYNYARYLPSAIDSALAQTYPDTEIIVVDDGSTDDSRNAIAQCQQRAPHRIKAIFQENQGQGGAFNTGFEASSGEIIAFLDADDVWKPNKLQRVVEALSTPDVVGTMHQLDIIDGDGNVTDSGSINGRIPSGDLARVIINTGNAWWFPPTSGLAYRRSALQKVLPMDAVKWRLWADGCLIYCTAFLGKIKTLNEFLEHIGYPDRVDLSRNLQYRQLQYYLQGKWDADEVRAISGLILGWPFYTWQERPYYLARFLMKSAGFLARPTSHAERTT